ncbi:MAG: Nramp family divalent metal transporter [Gemmatimonadota bacterium]|nr:MAG: Nramp family divalent metal transporter [Gemmatimonadota bacterium]
MKRWRGAGPGLIVTAAFIGPGTITTATLAGAQYGVTLLWALLFATVATIVLQEMSARLGLATGAGLAQALRTVGGHRWLGPSLAALAAVAVIGGAAAYEAGNLTGAGLGLESITGLPLRAWVALGTALAGVLLLTGQYRLVERVLAGCVAVMGVVFLTTAVLVAPSLDHILTGAFVPRLPEDAELNALALIGTTIVPYNLFLHAAVVRERWADIADLPAVRWDLVLAIGLGGIVSCAVVITASSALDGTAVRSAGEMATQLEPLLGAWAGQAFALGYAAAGISSAITAPLAAAYIVLDTMGRSRDVRAPAARVVWIGCILVGAVTALLGTRPVPLIVLVQVVNGLVLPIVAAVLLIAMNDRRRLGDHVNSWRGNVVGVAVVLLCAGLGLRSIVLAL